MTVNGTDVLIDGSGPSLVFVHGWPDTARLWERQVAALESRYRCVRVTLPGFEPGSRRAYSFAEVVERRAWIEDTMGMVSLVVRLPGGPALVAAVLTVGLCAAAYISEILRGALNAIPKGQAEAAAAIGLGPRDLWVRILLPQALKISMPAMVNELILLVKASSLVTVVGIVEITRMSQSIASSTYRPLEIYLAAAFIYLAINLVLAAIGRWLERRLAV